MDGLIVSLILYLLILFLFLAFGKFLKDADKQMHEQMQRREKDNDSH